jgi:hypothetical protein
MHNRPCKPNADLKLIWRTLMPGTPFPACGVEVDENSTARENAAPAKEPHDGIKRPRD